MSAPTAAASQSALDNASTSYEDIPPFPDNVPTCPLLRISLRKLLVGDQVERERLWSASCSLGFFYLDLRTDSGEAAELLDPHEGSYVVDGESLIQEAGKINKEVITASDGVFGLPLEEKVKYDADFTKNQFG